MTKTKIIPKGTEQYVHTGNTPLGYIEYNPLQEEGMYTKNLPLVIAFHGKGDGGKNPGSLTDLTTYRNKKGHLPNMLETGEIAPECIVIIPQTDGGYLEGNSLVKFRDYIADVYQTENIAIMGLSAGGASVWKALDTVIKKENGEDIYVANLFKAFIPICGAYEQKKPFAFPDDYSPNLWAFHGSKDTTVFPHWSIKNCGWITGYFTDAVNALLVKLSEISKITKDITLAKPTDLDWLETALQTRIYNLICTIYANEGHGIWGKVYKNEMMWQWLISRLTGEEQPPVEEERPLKDVSDIDLIYFAAESTLPWSNIPSIDVETEISIRTKEKLKKYNL